jgi:hypothetical protein
MSGTMIGYMGYWERGEGGGLRGKEGRGHVGKGGGNWDVIGWLCTCIQSVSSDRNIPTISHDVFEEWNKPTE